MTRRASLTFLLRKGLSLTVSVEQTEPPTPPLADEAGRDEPSSVRPALRLAKCAPDNVRYLPAPAKRSA